MFIIFIDEEKYRFNSPLIERNFIIKEKDSSDFQFKQKPEDVNSESNDSFYEKQNECHFMRNARKSIGNAKVANYLRLQFDFDRPNVPASTKLVTNMFKRNGSAEPVIESLKKSDFEESSISAISKVKCQLKSKNFVLPTAVAQNIITPPTTHNTSPPPAKVKSSIKELSDQRFINAELRNSLDKYKKCLTEITDEKNKLKQKFLKMKQSKENMKSVRQSKNEEKIKLRKELELLQNMANGIIFAYMNRGHNKY